MIARVAAVLSSSRDWKENVLQFAPDNSQQDNKTLQVTNTSRTKLGKTYHLNFARWRRGSCAGRIPSLLKPIFARIAARKGLGTVSRPGTIECAPCSIPCQYLGQATHKILKWVYRRKKETLQSESMTAIDTCMQDTYRKGCENESSAKVMLHVHTCAKWVICMMRDWLVKKKVLHAVFLHCFLLFVRWRRAIFMVPGNKFGIFHGTSNKVLGQGEQVLPHCGCRSGIHLDLLGSQGKHRKTHISKR